MPELTRRQTCVYIGVDPGKEGGIAVIGIDGSVAAVPLILTRYDLWRYVFEIGRTASHETYRHQPRRAVVEKVGGFIKGNPAPGSAMFNFGVSYGELLMALTAAGVSVEEVPPQAWQRAMGLPTRGGNKQTKTQWKRFLRGKAQQLYPDLPLWSEPRSVGRQLAVADALLIATYCQRKHEGKLG